MLRSLHGFVCVFVKIRKRREEVRQRQEAQINWAESVRQKHSLLRTHTLITGVCVCVCVGGLIHSDMISFQDERAQLKNKNEAERERGGGETWYRERFIWARAEERFSRRRSQTEQSGSQTADLQRTRTSGRIPFILQVRVRPVSVRWLSSIYSSAACTVSQAAGVIQPRIPQNATEQKYFRRFSFCCLTSQKIKLKQESTLNTFNGRLCYSVIGSIPASSCQMWECPWARHVIPTCLLIGV